jgi:hypothetical protein
LYSFLFSMRATWPACIILLCVSSQINNLCSQFYFNHNLLARSVVSTAVEIQVEVFRVVTPCNVVVGYQRFRNPWYLNLQGEPPKYW